MNLQKAVTGNIVAIGKSQPKAAIEIEARSGDSATTIKINQVLAE